MDQAFRDAITAGYAFDEPTIVLGSAMHEGELFNDARVQVALSMLNRHGLIAGATGTGKTKTLQLMAGQLSDAGVPVFVADIKGDLTGLAAPGTMSPKLQERLDSMALLFEGRGHPLPALTLKAMRRRWGSMSARGRMCLNVDLIRAPRQCIELVVVHELCHLEEKFHDAAFYRLLGLAMPDWRPWKAVLQAGGIET